MSKLQNLDPKARWLFFFQFLPVFVILAIFLGMFLVPLLMMLLMVPMVLIFANGQSQIALTGLAAALIPLLGIIIFSIVIFLLANFWAKLTWKNYTYQIKDGAIEIQRGVIWKRLSSIPFERIQNIDILRGIFARILGLSDLQIQTAGYSGAVRGIGLFALMSEGRLPGLNQEVASSLKEEILKKVGVSKSKGL